MATKRKPSKAAAAKAEVKAKERTIEWEGLTFTLPAVPSWDDILAEMALVRKSDDPVVGMEMLIELVGVAQYREAMKVLTDKKRNKIEGLAELTNQVLEQYGTSEGE